jgi:crotonobetainyl-CoA:carnitine CoA-transferase CaiB-like acyl-CoA transferase
MVLVTGMTAPLTGIRVLEVAHWLAAPAAGARLADLGARGPAPEAGAHTFDVLAEIGVSDEELAQLATDGVI